MPSVDSRYLLPQQFGAFVAVSAAAMQRREFVRQSPESCGRMNRSSVALSDWHLLPGSAVHKFLTPVQARYRFAGRVALTLSSAW